MNLSGQPSKWVLNRTSMNEITAMFQNRNDEFEVKFSLLAFPKAVPSVRYSDTTRLVKPAAGSRVHNPPKEVK